MDSAEAEVEERVLRYRASSRRLEDLREGRTFPLFLTRRSLLVRGEDSLSLSLSVARLLARESRSLLLPRSFQIAIDEFFL